MSDTSKSRRIESISPAKRALLMRMLEQRRGKVAEAQTIARQSGAGPFVLSFAQQRLWFLDQWEPNSALYNVPVALRIHGPLHREAFARALEEIVRRHDALRTTFRAVDGRPVQDIRPSMGLPLQVEDLREVSLPERDTLVEERASEEARQPFDLAEGPLVRAKLIQLAEDEHVFLLTMHHIVSDGWSIGVLLKELSAIYEAFRANRPSPLSDLPLQYVDFAIFQRQLLEGKVIEEQLGYWKQKLAGALPSLDLPADRPRPVLLSYRGASKTFQLPGALKAALWALGQRAEVTPFMILLAAFQVLLGRYTGATDVCVGSPVAGRSRPDLEGLIGLFLNTLVLRADLSDDPTFFALLKRVREVTLGAYDHQDVPFEQVVDALSPPRDMSRTPLFQVMFVLQNTPLSTIALADLTLRPLEFSSTTAKFDLTLSIEELEGGLRLWVEYSTDLFESSTIERMLLHFQTLLEGIARGPERKISELPLLSEAERHRALVVWNETRASYPDNRCLHELFEEQAARNPEAVAVVAADERLSYGALNRRANRLARALRESGARPGQLIGVVLDKGWAQVVSVLAIEKAGGAYLPIDPEMPVARIGYLLSHGQVDIVLTLRRVEEPLGLAPQLRRLYVEELSEGASEQDDRNLERAQSPDDLAYVIYTSGSTGLPKGVMIDHRGPVNTLIDINTRFAVNAADRVLGLSALNFDLSVYDIFGTLAAGATLVMPDPALLREPSHWAELVEREQVTVWNTVPALLELLVEHASAQASVKLGSLRLSLLSGDWIPVSLPDRFRRLVAGAQVISLGGATEASIWSILYPIEQVERSWRSIPYGRPMLNQRFYVLEGGLEPCGVGVEGALYIGGIGLAKGYWRDEAITSAAFIEHPRTGERLYRTGDLGRYLPDGTIEFLGRKDFQVKIRGFRIELGEIEVALSHHPELREAVVIVREDGAGDKRLCAYVVAAHAPGPSAAELRSYLKDRLPEYMVPPVIVSLSALPLTPNGKVDRRALPAPEAAAPPAAGAFVGPRAPMEEVLASVFAQVLGLERVGVHDNFFALGGDSILAIQVVSRARRAGVGLLVRQIFQHQSVGALAKVAVGAKGPSAEQGLVTGAVPLTPIQQWFFEQHRAEEHHFNQAVLLSVREPLEIEALEEALAELYRHHDVLRLSFVREGDGITQAHAGVEGRVSVRMVDLSAVPAERQAQALEAAASEVQASVRLEAPPLLRAALFELGPGRGSRLLIVIHHLAIDGVSWRILLEDLETAYQQRRRGEPMSLPFKTASFKQWAEKLLMHARSESIREDLAFWLTASSRPPLPGDLHGGDNTVASARTVEVELGPEQTQALLQHVPEVYRTQINDVLLTAVVQALSPWIASRSLRLDLEGHGREDIGENLDLSRTAGWFTALYPVELELVPGSLGGALKTIKEQLRKVPNRGISHGLLRYLHPDPAVKGALASLPQAEVIFNYLGQLDQGRSDTSLFNLASEPTGPAHSPLGRRSHILEINAWIVASRLHIGWTYSERLHRRATIEELAHRFIHALDALIAHCQSPGAGGRTITDFPLSRLTQAALDRLVGTGREVEDLYPLSPMQQGMLFHTLQEPTSGMYVEQLTFRSDGGLDVAAFRAAWQSIVSRHPILRTAFVWAGLERPLQIVRPEAVAPLPWVEHDLRGLSAEAQQEELSRMLYEDRARGFELDRAPLLRLSLARLTDGAYQCTFSFHHLLLDGWSLPLLFREVLEFYDAARRGKVVHLALPRVYRDYITWLGRADLGRAEAFWREALRGFYAPTELRLEHPEAGRAAPTASHLDAVRWLPEATTTALMDVARAHGLTLNTLVQGALAILLSRYSGESDVVFGGAVSGRSAGLEGMPEMIGLFINTLPVRARFTAGATVVSFLRALQAQQAEQLPYEYSPLAEVQRWSEIPRGKPLFSSLLVVENYPVDAAVGQGTASLAISDVRFAEKTNYPLTIEVVPGKELFLRFLYAADLFDEATLARMLGHFEALLEGFTRAPEARLSALSLLTAEEQRRLLSTWNDTRAAYPAETCVHHLFEAQVERSPEAIALSFEAEELSYRDLNGRANKLAHHLRSLGVGPDVLVGICVRRSIDMIVAVLAVLKAGGAYVPLDPTYPADRLAFMIEDAQVPVLLSQDEILDELPAGLSYALSLDDLEPSLASAPASNPPPSAGPGNLAYVIYTSGSTGKPKGVLLEHRGLCNLTEAQRKLFGVKVGTRVLQFARMSFDASVWEIFMTLTAGGTLYLAPQAALIPGPDLAALLREAAINVITVPPSALSALPSEPLKALHTIIVAGEACSADLVARWAPSCRFFDAYGPTETTVCATIAPCDASGGAPVIGRPLPNVRVYVLDAQKQPVPVGIPGELHVGGVNLARGYLNRPERTAEAFIPDPFSSEPGARLYRTGDLVRWRPDGTLDYLGRVDHQIKIRGFRIEPGEIEATLERHPAVREAVVRVREDTPGDKRLVAYVTGDAPELKATSELRRFLAETLPDYMVPAVFVAMDAMPLTPNGKVDRQALPAPEQKERSTADGFTPPRTPVEELLSGIWAEVLGAPSVDVHADFFDLGGHSLLATQILARIRPSFSVDLPLRALFDSPTVAGLARRIEAARREAGAPPPPPSIEQASRDRDLPLSFAQQRLWFLDQLEPNSAFYSVPAAVHVRGSLDARALTEALSEVVLRHEALRTTFAAAQGRPRQIIATDPSLHLDVVDLSALAGEAREAEVRRRVAEEAQKPFDLARGPLVRTTLLKLSPDEHVLMLTMHHIVADGWSMGILLREMTALYEAFREGRPSPLSPLPFQYADYAVWQREWLEGAVRDAQLAYWKQKLAGAPPSLDLPTDRPRPPLQTFHGAALTFRLSPSLTASLTALSRRTEVTRFMTLLAAFQLLLARYAGSTDVSVGSPVAGRNRPELEGLIGFFVNTLVMRVDLGQDPSFVGLLERVREVTLDAYAHQDVPFEQVVDALGPVRDPSRTPLFQVLFVLQNAPLTALSLADLTLTPMESESTTARFDLMMSLTDVNGGGMEGMLEYNVDLFDAATVKRMIRHFETLLVSIVEAPERRLSELSILTPEELSELTAARDETRAELPGKLAHSLFEAQAARSPDAIAVVSGGRELTYRELDRRANQLAHHLRSLGVGPEVLVGLCVERSISMVVGLFGILKAGGAYVPLDPGYPAERLAFMIKDARLSVLLTEERFAGQLLAEGARVLYLDTDSAKIAKARDDRLTPAGDGSNLAYVIYTSGSTGRPKGAMIHHRGLINYLSWSIEAYAVAEGKGVPVQSSIAFDLTVTSVLAPLSAGQRILLLPEGPGVEALAVALRDGSDLSLLKITPSHLDALVADPSTEHSLRNVRAYVIGGEALSTASVTALRAHAPDARVFNEYGPTETVVGCSIEEVPPAFAAAGSVSIGRPIRNMQLYVLDPYLRPVPIGVTGELYIGGVGVARGYLHRPDLTAERFVPDPFSREPSARLYRTGDLARYRADGRLDFLGRIDHQVKIRGYRIELGEISAVLAEHESVREAIVICREDRAHDRRLVGYVALRSNEAEISEVRSFLESRLPEYMVPGALVVLDALPLTAHGKVDRAALPAPDSLASGRTGPFVGPRDAIELGITQIWEELLDIKPVGVKDDFFALGGHSLLAVQLLASIQDRFGQSLPLGALFQNATVEELAERLREGAAPRSWSPLVQIQGGGPGRPLFLVHPSGGTVLCYAALARHLGNASPIYGLAARGTEGDMAPHRRIEEMAAEYIEALRNIQSEGPYSLGGWSFGGLVALEMAQQLQKAGHTVALLALLDTDAFASLASEEAWDDASALADIATLQNLKVSPEMLKRLGPDELLRYFLDLAHDANLVPPSFDVPELKQWLRVYRTHYEAFRSYTPRPYTGKITLFRAKKGMPPAAGRAKVRERDPTLGWSKVSSEPVIVHEVPGDHESLVVEPDVIELAERLGQCQKDGEGPIGAGRSS